jgi:hypothetical protein
MTGYNSNTQVSYILSHQMRIIININIHYISLFFPIIQLFLFIFGVLNGKLRLKYPSLISCNYHIKQELKYILLHGSTTFHIFRSKWPFEHNKHTLRYPVTELWQGTFADLRNLSQLTSVPYNVPLETLKIPSRHNTNHFTVLMTPNLQQFPPYCAWHNSKIHRQEMWSLPSEHCS